MNKKLYKSNVIIYYNIDDLRHACERLKQLKIKYDIERISDGVNMLIIF